MIGTFLHALAGDPETEAWFSADADLSAMLQVEAALAGAQAAAGLIPADAAIRIADVCAAFRPDRDALEAAMARDGVVVPELVRQLRAAIGPPHAIHLHCGATSQDVVDTSLILRLKSVLTLIDRRLEDLIAVLDELALRQGSVVLMAQTRMQRALPFHAADKVATWRAPLDRHRARLAELAPRLLVLQLGGPVGTRAELGQAGAAIALDVASRLRLGVAMPWQSQRDRIAELGSLFSLVAGSLGKIGQDVALMAQNEIASVRLERSGGSSAMPHKQNPVLAEVLVALARFEAGLLGTLHQSLVHENERSGAAWTLEWLVLPQMAVAAGAASSKARELLAGLAFVTAADQAGPPLAPKRP